MMVTMCAARLYPEIDPYETGMLDVSDGQRLYWEQVGNPDGKPAVVLHGGPGSGCSPRWRRWFDPDAYRVVLFDQRGCGRSTPDAGDASTDLSVNTTWHLVSDIEALRSHLGVDRWLVWGGSWGSTLGLAYAESHPYRVTEIVLAPVTTSRAAEIDWLARGVRAFFPAEWQRFRDAVPEPERDEDLVAAYYRLLTGPDPAVREQAARDWCAWEDALVSLEGQGPDPRFEEPSFRLRFARLVTHYFSHRAFLDDGQLLRDVHRLAGVPGVLIHGRLDVGSPPVTAWELARAWPGSELHLVGAGHMGGDETTALIVEALDRFAARR
jgi:proline iminopeptidase